MRFFLFIILSVGLMACSQNDSQGANTSTTSSENTNSESNGPLKIDITVEGMSGGSAYLIGMYTDQNFRVDSVGVDAQGRFTFEKEEGVPSGLYFVLFPDNRNFQLLIDKEQQFSVTTKNNQLSNAVVVKGNKETELLYETRKKENPINNSLNAVSAQMNGLDKNSPAYEDLKLQQKKILKQKQDMLDEVFAKHPNSFFTSFKRSGQNPTVGDYYKEDGTEDNIKKLYEYRKEFWTNVDLTDERLIRTPVISNKLKRFIKDLTIQNPDSLKVSIDYLMDRVENVPAYYQYFTVWMINNYEPNETKLMDSQAIFVHMVKNYHTVEKATWSTPAETGGLQQRADEMKLSLVGLQGPDVVSTDQYGNKKSIYEMDQDYIVVYMYNPDCEHCQEETPKLMKFYNEWKQNGLGVFAIAIDTDDTKWKNYINSNRLQEWTHVYDPTNKSIYGKYFVDVTPEIYLLNPERKIIAKNLKTHQIITMIEQDKNN